MAIDFLELFNNNNSDHQHLGWARHHTQPFASISSFHPYPSFLGYILKWLPFPSEKTGVERDQHLIQVIQLGRGDGRIEPSQSHSSLVPFHLLTDCIFAAPSCTRATLPFRWVAKLSSGVAGHLGHFHTSSSPRWDSSTPKRPHLLQCLKLLGGGGCEILERCLSSCRPWCVIFSGNLHYNYSDRAPNNWVCTPHGPPALCSHRFDFIYDLFEHVSSRNNQDTLKCGSKHRRPTVSSQFKVSLCCWSGWTHLYCDFRNL